MDKSVYNSLFSVFLSTEPVDNFLPRFSPFPPSPVRKNWNFVHFFFFPSSRPKSAFGRLFNCLTIVFAIAQFILKLAALPNGRCRRFGSERMQKTAVLSHDGLFICWNL